LHFISGSSGGMIGASYFREVYLRKINGDSINLYDKVYAENISKDILNPVAFTITVNDLFLRIKQFKYDNTYYTTERGYAFEHQLQLNTNFFLEKKLRDYAAAEAKGIIPTMVLSPTVVNDAKRLIIATRNMAFLGSNMPVAHVRSRPIVDNIEFLRFFEKQNAGNLRFSTALRMSATFPYIMPNISLPSTPAIQVMDAGIRDNYGLSLAIKYLYTFREWIAQNCSGVIIIQLRDKMKDFDISQTTGKSMFQNITSPIGSFYTNWPYIQNYDQDQELQYAGHWFAAPIDVIQLQLEDDPKNPISLSWHLTEREKKKVKKSVYMPKNIEELKRLQKLLN
jgi:hypothetical protein